MATKLSKPVRRVTEDTLDGSYGVDKFKPVVITIRPTAQGSFIELRPHGTRRTESISVMDVYRFAMRCRVSRVVLEKARLKKAKKIEQRASRRIAYADRKFRKPINPDEGANSDQDL